MSQTHYYYALNRKAAERVLDLTWVQFLKRYGWRGVGEWDTLGPFLAYSVDRPLLPEEPTERDLAPLLNWTLRKTIARSSPQYYVLFCLNRELPRGSFVEGDLGCESLEGECDALIHCALRAHERGEIDDRTCWAVLTLNDPWPYPSWGAALGFFEGIVRKVTRASGGEVSRSLRGKAGLSPDSSGLTVCQNRCWTALKRRFGRSKPIFDWQPVRAVRDGHSALNEADTLRFCDFLRAAWRHNWPVWEDGTVRRQRFRDFELTGLLSSWTGEFRGNCLVHYWGP